MSPRSFREYVETGAPDGPLRCLAAVTLRLRIMGLALLVAGTVASCSTTDRPDVAIWQTVWETTKAGIPAAADLGQPPDRTVCDTTLGFLRSANADLFPTPDPAIDEVVRDWVQVAEDAFFECPPSSNVIPDFATAYAELEQLEAEVEAVLTIDRGSG